MTKLKKNLLVDNRSCSSRVKTTYLMNSKTIDPIKKTYSYTVPIGKKVELNVNSVKIQVNDNIKSVKVTKKNINITLK